MLLFSMTTGYAQSKNRGVQGDVVDLETGLPIPDVSISTNLGGRVGKTDARGKFVISIPAEAKTLVFSNIKYETLTRELTSSLTPISVQLTAKKNDIEEVMVVGYQQRTRETLIGSVAVITAKDIKDVPAANVMELLQGKVAGLNIQNNNGMPGMRGSMSIRGVSNFNVSGGGDEAFMSPSSPLFVIDGIPLDDNGGFEYGFNQAGPGISPISLIPTEDIERIEVLKDAQATALYGSRGAYGVIIITTKRGNSKIPIVQLTSNFFISTPPSLRSVIGGAGERRSRIDQILSYDTSANRYSGHELIDRTVFLSDSLNPYFNNNTDWQSYFYRTTYNQTHNLNVSGGDQQFNYKVNSGIYSEKGIQRSTGFTRYSMQMNSQYRPNDKFRMFAALNGSVGLNTEGSGNGLLQSGVASGGNTSSLLPPPTLFNASNGLWSTLEIESLNKTSAFSVNTEFEYEFLKNLRAITSIGYNYKFANKDKFKGAALNENVSDLYAYNDKDVSLYNRNQLRYNLDWNDSDHQLNFGIFNEIDVKTFRADVINQIGSANDDIRGPIGINYFSSKGGTLNNLSEVRTASFAASANYNYKRRYVFEANYRLDGTSSNGPLNPWSYNPSLGGKWNINNEEFTKDWFWMDFAALRLTWGRNTMPTGNIFDVYGRYVTSYKYNNIQTVTLNNRYIPNMELQSQAVTQWNYGLDLGLFRNFLSITYDAYYKEVIGELTSTKLANHNSFAELRTNEQALVNYGQELTLQFRPLRNKNDWNWTFSVNGAYNKDVITRLPDGVRQVVEKDASDYQLSTLYRIGRNSSTFVLLHNTGVYATDDDVPVDPYTGLRMRIGGNLIEERFLRAGDPIWTDLNGDFIIDDKDYVYVGNYQPLFTGGFTSFLSWKDWQLTVNASFTLKRDILNTAASDLMKNFSNPGGRQDEAIYSPSRGDRSISAWVPVGYYDYWMSEGNVAMYPNPYDYLRSQYVNPFRSDQTLFIEDGSYLKINSATLSYNIPRTFSQRYGITSFRVYLTAANLYNFNQYSGPDPESVSNTGRDSSKGYPNKRMFTFGINVQF